MDESRFQPLEIPSLIGYNSKLCELTEWNPEYKIKNTLKDNLNDWEIQ